jgi:hypothetical protein
VATAVAREPDAEVELLAVGTTAEAALPPA